MYVFRICTNNNIDDLYYRGGCKMPVHKDKQQAFQAAQQGYTQAKNAQNQLSQNSSEYGTQLKHLKQEVNEAYEQIQNALEVASEHQRSQLEQYEQDLQQIVQQVNEE
jgi:phenylalanyl-tRNA synthetase alpha subunit